MKRLIYWGFYGAIITLGPVALPAWADLEVSGSVQIRATAEFEAPLAAHGGWVEIGSYGRCWRPAHVGVEWRPYGCGEWVWTDCGWYWQSEEPWAWACYHYGSWVYDPAFGWVWVPGVEWAPAWVSWRIGGGYIGWAPLPPPGWFFVNHPRAELFVFVGEAKFGGPVRPGAYIVNNKSIVKGTAEIGGIQRESHNLGGPSSQKVLVNHGPGVDRVQTASGKRFAAVSIHEAVRRTPGRAQAKHLVTDAHGRQGKSGAESQPAIQPDHGPDHGDKPGSDSVKSGPDRDHGPLFGGDAGSSGGRGHGGGWMGGGRGKH